MDEIKELKLFAMFLAKESGKIIKRYFKNLISVQTKSDNSPVTIADRKAEEKMRNLIIKHYPDHGILGEEFGIENENAEFKWIIDPIDGTKSFIHGMITFGTLIALTKNDSPILGIINQPVTEELLLGDNSTALLNGKQAKVRNCESLSVATLLTTDHLNIEKYQNITKFESLIKKVKIYRTWGNCYGYYMIASGFADIMIDPIMSVWDSAALIPIITGAGGTITDYQGNDPMEGNSIIATSGNIHKNVLELLN